MPPSALSPSAPRRIRTKPASFVASVTLALPPHDVERRNCETTAVSGAGVETWFRLRRKPRQGERGAPDEVETVRRPFRNERIRKWKNEIVTVVEVRKMVQKLE